MSFVAFRKGLEGLGGCLGSLGGLCKRQKGLPPLGGLLGASWGPLGASWGPLGSLLEHEPPPPPPPPAAAAAPATAAAWGIVELIVMKMCRKHCTLQHLLPPKAQQGVLDSLGHGSQPSSDSTLLNRFALIQNGPRA